MIKVTFVKVSEEPQIGEYKPTSIDEAKKNADILLTSITGSSYTIKVQNPDVNLGGKRGVQRQYNDRLFDVTETKWNQLSAKYSTHTDF